MKYLILTYLIGFVLIAKAGPTEDISKSIINLNKLPCVEVLKINNTEKSHVFEAICKTTNYDSSQTRYLIYTTTGDVKLEK